MEDYYKTMELGFINHMMVEVAEDMAGRDHTKEEWSDAFDKVMEYTLVLLEEKYHNLRRKKNIEIHVPRNEKNYEISNKVTKLLKEFKVELLDDYSGGSMDTNEWETGWDFANIEDKEQFEPIIKQMFA
tara:strand:- start:837 stop:1223 length:387 start_codon:yes stop_codon:yes gene_type:complete